MYYNFLNFPAIRFKRASLKCSQKLHDDMVEFFDKKEDEGMKWRDDYFDAMAENNDEKLALLKKQGKHIYLTDCMLDILINTFTRERTPENLADVKHYKDKILEIQNKYIKDIVIEDSFLEIKTCYGTFRAYKLSETHPFFGPVSKFLESDKRYKMCHRDAEITSRSIEENNKVATGYVVSLGEFNRYLHSWVELIYNGEPVVIDTTSNLLMDKKGYYLYKNIKGPVYKISKSTLQKELPIRDYLYNHDEWLFKLYLSDRPQALQVYRRLRAEQEKKDMQDPDYRAAKAMSDAFKRYEKQFQKEQKRIKKLQQSAIEEREKQ